MLPVDLSPLLQTSSLGARPCLAICVRQRHSNVSKPDRYGVSEGQLTWALPLHFNSENDTQETGVLGLTPQSGFPDYSLDFAVAACQEFSVSGLPPGLWQQDLHFHQGMPIRDAPRDLGSTRGRQTSSLRRREPVSGQ